MPAVDEEVTVLDETILDDSAKCFRSDCDAEATAVLRRNCCGTHMQVCGVHASFISVAWQEVLPASVVCAKCESRKFATHVTEIFEVVQL